MHPAALPCPHTPLDPQRADAPKYVFYEACWAGCLGCVKKLLEARPGLISEEPDNQGYTGLAWAEFGVEKGRVECHQVVEYLQVKKQELANEEESAAQAAAGSRSAELGPSTPGNHDTRHHHRQEEGSGEHQTASLNVYITRSWRRRSPPENQEMPPLMGPRLFPSWQFGNLLPATLPSAKQSIHH